MRLRPLPRPTATPLHRADDEIAELWKALDERASRRERTGGYSGGYRCWGCRKFVSGPTVTCPHCGQQHGGIYHEAYATR